MNNSSSSISRSGVSGRYSGWFGNNNFAICNPTPTDFNGNGPAAYVSLEPNQGTGTQILQIGLTECALAGSGACQGEGHPRHFWARGGCNGEQPLPYDLGAAIDGATYTYAIWLDVNNYYHLEINGATKVTIAKSHSAIGCWTPGINYGIIRATWMFERWDTGDSNGQDSLTRSYLDNAAYGVVNQGWFNTNWVAGACYVNQPDDVCRNFGPRSFSIYTVN
jgi:hypothetical protein